MSSSSMAGSIDVRGIGVGMAIATCTGGAVIVVTSVGAAMTGWGWGACASIGAMSAEGLITELVVSGEGEACSIRLPRPELEVQPARARLARTIADAAEKRIGTRTQNKTGAKADSPRFPTDGNC
ncbi:hypothetical protein HNQ96_005242 [Aminobacter lissarensis]|uniref:Uncharacterized protein n=1 Tax=Aminobacter carboxidus TaxID=376165 RepID=A0A8E1WJ01_9HYPH|nr:hypothetical protein [Aminobacter lissarensis]